MCKSWMLQRLEKLICLVRSFSMSCDIFDLHICQDRWKLENWCLLMTQVDCRIVKPMDRLEHSLIRLELFSRYSQHPRCPGCWRRCWPRCCLTSPTRWRPAAPPASCQAPWRPAGTATQPGYRWGCVHNTVYTFINHYNSTLQLSC